MISIKDITKTYQSGENSTQALKGVSFDVQDGEFVAIMGPSGSGKSTLMHIIGALDSPTSGEYLLQSKKIEEYSKDELADVRKRQIGFVFQAFNLLPRTTALRNVGLPLIYDRVPENERNERAQQALDSVGIHKELWHHLSNQLSGGQVQRVAIARALVTNPALILADEPTGNLDTKTGDMVLEVFNQLNQEGHTIVLITHELEIAERASRIIYLRDGVIESDRFVDKNRRKEEADDVTC